MPRATGFVLAVACAACSAADILVVTDHRHPVNADPVVRLIELDATGRVVALELAAHLPADAEQAATMVRQRLQYGSAALQKRLVAACQGVVEAWSLGITKIPAVIVDRKYVVYGVQDVDHAVAMIEQYRSAQR